jgi:hypothetical protein
MTALEWVTRRLARELARQARTGRYTYGPDIEVLEHLHAILTRTAEGRMYPDESAELIQTGLSLVEDPKLKAGLLAVLGIPKGVPWPETFWGETSPSDAAGWLAGRRRS